jgi:hypothetical protein
MNEMDDEMRAEYVRAMGAELGDLFYDLSNDFDWLEYKWRELQELFGGGAERTELLNIVASNFFYLVKKLLFEDVMLHLSRLTDRESESYDHLTLRRLAGAVEPSLRDQIANAIGNAVESCRFAKSWRDRRLAHTDRDLIHGEHKILLPTVDASNIQSALRSIHALLDIIVKRYSLPPSASVGDPWGAKSLLHHLERAIRAEDEERLESGK